MSAIRLKVFILIYLDWKKSRFAYSSLTQINRLKVPKKRNHVHAVACIPVDWIDWKNKALVTLISTFAMYEPPLQVCVIKASGSFHKHCSAKD